MIWATFVPQPAGDPRPGDTVTLADGTQALYLGPVVNGGGYAMVNTQPEHWDQLRTGYAAKGPAPDAPADEPYVVTTPEPVGTVPTGSPGPTVHP